jgi:hypothetical protein
MKRIAFSVFGFVLFAALLGAAQQSQPSTPQPQDKPQPSLAESARQAKKDNPQPKARPKVFDNDNIPREDKLSVVGAPAAVTADNSSGNAPAAADDKTADTKTAVAPEDDPAKRQAIWKQWQQKISTQKDQADLLTRELDLLKREYQVRAAAFYADAGDRLRNSASWDKQDAQYKQQIADKQKAVDDARQKIDDLQEEARKAGVPAAMRE